MMANEEDPTAPPRLSSRGGAALDFGRSRVVHAMIRSDLAQRIGAGELFPWPVEGDNMEPTLKRGGFVICRRVDDFIGEGVYLLSDGVGNRLCRAARVFGRAEIELRSDNRLYTPYVAPLRWFQQHVIAKAAFNVAVL